MTASVPNYRVQFSPEVRDKLGEIEARIVAAGTPQTATPSVDAIVEFYMALAIFPDRGVSCDDLLPGYE